ncbi:MAG: sigma-70 family RNA polymerase sigma factor [Pirellulales bacterium]|nr:sigma-70 family RNA polymerase sigma factor [Pirellulales bacterium]
MKTVPPSDIDELICSNQGLVRSIALKIHSKLPRHILLDDLIADGQVGLAQAATVYQPESGASFSTFAYYRIRGAIYDGLSKMSWTSRSTLHRLRSHRLAGEFLDEQASEKSATNAKSTAEEAEWVRETTEKLAVVYLASQVAIMERDDLPDLDPDTKTPDWIVAEREVLESLRAAVAALPEPDRRLIRWAYYDGLSLTEIARRCGHHKAWASRLHSRILGQLGRSLQALGAA